MQQRVRVVLAGAAMAAILGFTQVLTVSAEPVRFGSRLTPETMPQPEVWCTPSHVSCTWLLREEYSDGPPLPVSAPKAGTIGRVRLQSCSQGTFRVQVARRVPGTSRWYVRKDGPRVSYEGDLDGCDDDTHRVESIPVNFTVRKGDRIAIRAKRTGAVRCNSGGSPTLLFRPPLVDGGSSRVKSDTLGCWLLIQWQYKS